jgi:sterol desaturase/sphingolipid hydroxylase (fatty acid hydroxylase superfamily)
MAAFEVVAPGWPRTLPRRRRWLDNLALTLLNAVLLRVLLPAAAVAAAVRAEASGGGLLHAVPLPHGVAFVAAVIALDFVIYLQHVVFHAVPVLWRLHVVHHADADVDVTTGTRFHPIEMGASALVKVAAVTALGAAPGAVIVFELLLNGTSVFNHGNVRLPDRLDGLLRLLLVTPAMHRIHHSVDVRDSNANYGFCLSTWDRLFGTLRSERRRGGRDVTVGVAYLERGRWQRLFRLLALPFLPAARPPASPAPATPDAASLSVPSTRPQRPGRAPTCGGGTGGIVSAL